MIVNEKTFFNIGILVTLTGCSNYSHDDPITTLPTGYSYSFKKDDDQRNFKVIYEYADGRKIISEFANITYQNYDEDTGKLNLEDAIENGVITIDDLINKMDFLSTANDGGSNLYIYGEKSMVYLFTCHTLSGNENIIIGTDPDIIEQCQIS